MSRFFFAAAVCAVFLLSPATTAGTAVKHQDSKDFHALDAGRSVNLADEHAFVESVGDAPPRKLQTSDSARDPATTYQITLWTSIVIALLILFSTLAVMNMQTERDPLLYTKLQATR